MKIIDKSSEAVYYYYMIELKMVVKNYDIFTFLFPSYWPSYCQSGMSGSWFIHELKEAITFDFGLLDLDSIEK
jgi:nicotinamidase-related amidase